MRKRFCLCSISCKNSAPSVFHIVAKKQRILFFVFNRLGERDGENTGPFSHAREKCNFAESWLMRIFSTVLYPGSIFPPPIKLISFAVRK